MSKIFISLLRVLCFMVIMLIGILIFIGFGVFVCYFFDISVLTYLITMFALNIGYATYLDYKEHK